MTPSSERLLTREQIHTRLWELTAKQFDKDPATLRAEDRFLQDLGADSLDVAELSMVVEDDLGVVLPTEVMDNPNLTLGQVEQVLLAKQAAK